MSVSKTRARVLRTAVAAGKISLGGFCRGIVREDIDLVRNSCQFYAPLNGRGWENGVIPDAISRLAGV